MQTIKKAAEVRTAREDIEGRFGLDMAGWHVYYSSNRPLLFSFEARMIIGHGGACSGAVGFLPGRLEDIIHAENAALMDVVYLGIIEIASRWD